MSYMNGIELSAAAWVSEVLVVLSWALVSRRRFRSARRACSPAKTSSSPLSSGRAADSLKGAMLVGTRLPVAGFLTNGVSTPLGLDSVLAGGRVEDCCGIGGLAAGSGRRAIALGGQCG